MKKYSFSSLLPKLLTVFPHFRVTGWSSTAWVVGYSSISCSACVVGRFTVHIDADHAVFSGCSTPVPILGEFTLFTLFSYIF